MTHYLNTLTSLSHDVGIGLVDMKALITEGLYAAPSEFSVNKAGLWILDDKKKAYSCLAYFFNEVVDPEQLPLITEDNDLALFSLLQNTSDIIEDGATYELLSNKNQMVMSAFKLQSVLLIPLNIKGENKGFIFLGNSINSTVWSDNIVFTFRFLSQLFIRSLLAVNNKSVEIELQHKNQLMNEIERITKTGAWCYGITTGEIEWTDETFRIHGLPVGDVISIEQGIKYYGLNAQTVIEKAFSRAITHFEPYELELPFIDAQGNHKWVRTTGKIRYDLQGATHVYGAFEDITQQKQLFESEKSTSKNLKSIVDNLNDCILTISDKGLIRSANRVVEKTFGYSPHELIGRNISKLMPEPFASSHGKYMQNYLQTGNAQIIGIGRELPAMKKDGSIFPMELSISEVLHGQTKVFIGIVRDITERKKAEQEIHKLAYFDDTTNILNRHSFERDLKKSFDKSMLINEDVSVFLVNIDKFSQINLTYGEGIGDDILRMIASRLTKSLPPSAVTYRNSADSFYIMAKFFDISLIFQTELAQQIIKEINQSIEVENKLIKVQASVGILNVSSQDINYIDIKPLLELAVFKAKKQGGNCYVFADSNEASILKRHSELSMAMKNNKFTSELAIVLQPQYSPYGDIVGSEVLVRWFSSIAGFVSPGEFIPLAEKNGAIIELGEWVIDKACILLSQRRLFSTSSSPISVNISAKQIAQPNFVDKLRTKLDEYKIPYSEMVLEITESALIADFDLVIGKMQLLKNKGFHFSIDDFGTGYSSLSYIHHLPISELKIDKCFVDDIKNSTDEVPIINTIIQMAKSLHLKVVAEGVECKAQLDYLKQHGCDVIQGYYFSKPLEPEEWLDNWALEHIETLPES
ncbi:EAL domain-containing protein [Colwellia sp. BRX8-9]|uniref:EAL domain-containing protein n=1 Tax=Colwellia sp. BRX8-9 TaxID=2759831 RepID=UPI0015F440E3|nr:EAL domain-containing protein [Colwellia sp. BRX8-9]MBA6349855.1 EAL domain-containing protein [Colwellia sp. BRX8-9]